MIRSFRKETELPCSHKGGDDVAEETRVEELWEVPSEAAILLKIESLDSGLTALSRSGKAPPTPPKPLPRHPKSTPRKPAEYPSHKSSFILAQPPAVGRMIRERNLGSFELV